MFRTARLLALPIVLFCAQASAATLSFRAPAACGDSASIRAQVERLVGTPFDAIADFDFAVQISAGNDATFTLVLKTRVHGDAASERVREINADSCDEAMQAAAVAIAMTVVGQDEASTATAKPSPATPTAAPAQPPVTQPATTAEPERVDDEAQATGATSAASDRWRVTLAAGASLDVGTLPALGAGATLEGGLGYRSVRVIAFGTLFATQTTRMSDGRGGAFSLAFGGLLLCGERHFSALRSNLCGGLEVGVMNTTGVGLDLPAEAWTLHRAARLEAGAAFDLTDGLAIAARLGVTVPLARPVFTVDRDETLHRPSRVTARATLVLEIVL